MSYSLKALVTTFVTAIDLYNHILKDHHRRVAIIAAHLGRACGLDDSDLDSLILAASLHDIGALSIEERQQLVHMDIENPHPHAQLGAHMLSTFPPFKEISTLVFYHHWPYESLDNYDPVYGPVPFGAFVLHLADRIDILLQSHKGILDQIQEITREITQRNHRLFHPRVVQAYLKVKDVQSFWMDIDNVSLPTALSQSLQKNIDLPLTTDLMTDFAYTASQIIDCRSAFTAAHSYTVSVLAYDISKYMGLQEPLCQKIKIAGLLHDIGKIGVDPQLIDKRGPLTPDERQRVKAHAYYTRLILEPLKPLCDICHWAAHHHENHTGGGYPDNYTGQEITLEMDILAYADIFTALAEDRPYRSTLSRDDIRSLLCHEFKDKHGSQVLQVILDHFSSLHCLCMNALKEGYSAYHAFQKKAASYAKPS